MKRLFLYFLVLMALVPLGSFAKKRPGVLRHIAASPEIVVNGLDDSIKVMIPASPMQDGKRVTRRDRIKEVPRAKPQEKPEKIIRRPVTRPADQGNAPRPNARPATRPPAGGTRPQGPQRPGK
jgi:hypothetical protein